MSKLTGKNNKKRLDKLLEAEDPVFDEGFERKSSEQKKEILKVAECDTIITNWEDQAIIVANGFLIQAIYKNHLITFKERDSNVKDFEFHDNILCDVTEEHGIYQTFSDKMFEAPKETTLNALCNWGNKLYFGGATSDGKGFVRDLSGNEKWTTDYPVTALCRSITGILYGDIEGNVSYLDSEEPKITVAKPIGALQDFRATPYCGHADKVRPVVEGEDKKRPSQVRALCVWGTRGKTLFDGGPYGIYDFFYEMPVYIKDNVDAMICIPKEMLEDELLSKHNIEL